MLCNTLHGIACIILIILILPHILLHCNNFTDMYFHPHRQSAPLIWFSLMLWILHPQCDTPLPPTIEPIIHPPTPYPPSNVFFQIVKCICVLNWSFECVVCQGIRRAGGSITPSLNRPRHLIIILFISGPIFSSFKQ